LGAVKGFGSGRARVCLGADRAGRGSCWARIVLGGSEEIRGVGGFSPV
jgi:hypothetical protein